MTDNAYGRELTAEEIATGLHREMVGGMWEEVGRLQLDYLRAEGLTPEATLLDVGCGCLRGGIHFSSYLEAGHYYGMDVNASLIKAGLERELPLAGLSGRVPPDRLLVNGAFEGWRFGVAFDYAIAQSVFTHVPTTAVAGALRELSRCLRPGGRLYATFFECEDEEVPELLVHEPGGITSYRDRDPFHYRYRDLAALCAGLPWRAVRVGEWGHPRDQRMIRFERTQE